MADLFVEFVCVCVFFLSSLFSSRIAASSATPTKKAGAGGRGGARSRGARRGRGGRRGGRRGPAAGSNKTAEQLDAEMDTYMVR